MYLIGDNELGRLPRHEGSWGLQVVKRHKDAEGNRVETTLVNKTGEIPMSGTKDPKTTAMVGTSEKGEQMDTSNKAMVGTSRGSN